MGDTPHDMCRPSGAHFEGDGIGYKYAAPLGLLEFAGLMRLSERDSSGTTKAANGGEGDGADSPTRAPEGREAARPKNVASLRFKYEI